MGIVVTALDAMRGRLVVVARISGLFAIFSVVRPFAAATPVCGDCVVMLYAKDHMLTTAETEIIMMSEEISVSIRDPPR